ncbi:hypothetical protein PR202_gb10412 [Eleusine coracana subsp. coracana]|uniref:Uncharacterized protein n=1 Tax=Eleusine coracana subsp. coracana TaxID=191504 RepID=A0AAV5EHJ0_ELECO|nr:hypothetical protein PR202_gb10412 [Eleusine coracana subsp. coracana]
MLPSASSRRSVMPEATADGAASRCSGIPEWILLDRRGQHMGSCSDAITTARSMTKHHGAIEVSLAVADPPALSRCVIRCPDLIRDNDDSMLHTCVTGADGAFLLIGVSFRDPEDGCPVIDVFLYRAAAPAGAPSLHRLPKPYPVGIHSNSVGLLSCGEQHCLVVVPKGRVLKSRAAVGYNTHLLNGDQQVEQKSREDGL